MRLISILLILFLALLPGCEPEPYKVIDIEGTNYIIIIGKDSYPSGLYHKRGL